MDDGSSLPDVKSKIESDDDEVSDNEDEFDSDKMKHNGKFEESK